MWHSPWRENPHHLDCYREKWSLGKIRILIIWNLRGNWGPERLDLRPRTTANSGRPSGPGLDTSHSQTGFIATIVPLHGSGMVMGVFCVPCIHHQTGHCAFSQGQAHNFLYLSVCLAHPGCRFSVYMVTDVCRVHYLDGGSIMDYPDTDPL